MFDYNVHGPNPVQPTSQEIAMRARSKEHKNAMFVASYLKSGHQKNNRGLKKLLTSLLTSLR